MNIYFIVSITIMVLIIAIEFVYKIYCDKNGKETKITYNDILSHIKILVESIEQNEYTAICNNNNITNVNKKEYVKYCLNEWLMSNSLEYETWMEDAIEAFVFEVNCNEGKEYKYE